MARMIPATIDPGTPSPGERDAFRRLADDPLASDWAVIHSLYLPNHVRQISGELDFVVLIPGKGILCIEVKAAASIARRDGVWFYGREAKGDPRGPLRQAAEGMHSLRERLKKRYPPSTRMVFWSAVCLPYTSLDFEAEEWHPWQLIDGNAYRAASLAASCEKVIDSAREFLHGRESARWFDPGLSVPTVKDCDAITRVLRPDFEAYQSPRARREQANSELLHYTEEQFVALDAMKLNPRVVFEGPAGTGKTVLAVEAAQRAASAGRRTLLVCFNRLLGNCLYRETESLGSLVTAGTLHSYMLELARLPQAPRDDPSFWEENLPLLSLERLLDSGGGEQFDLVIVDEAQDLLAERYLDVLDASVRGGLSGGEWMFFGDFERQSIYGGEALPLDVFRAERGGRAPVYSLRVNCRNKPRVAALVRILSHLDPDYERILRPDDGVEPDIRFYGDDRGAAELLERALAELRTGGYSGRDVVILSGRASGCAAERVDEQWRHRLRPLSDPGPGRNHVLYGTIHAFKGMEAPAVIVTDLDDVRGRGAEALLYVAVTRPTEKLLLLMHESTRARVGELIAGEPGARERARA